MNIDQRPHIQFTVDALDIYGNECTKKDGRCVDNPLGVDIRLCITTCCPNEQAKYDFERIEKWLDNLYIKDL